MMSAMIVAAYWSAHAQQGTPGQPSEPPREEPPGNPNPEIPPPVHEPGAPPQPQELPGKMPDEIPGQGPGSPTTPNPATDRAGDKRN